MAESLIAPEARRLLMEGVGLAGDPDRRATPTTLRRLIDRIGFVQVDSINIVERAHHHILLTRLDEYRPSMLEHLLERRRDLFEHWTHDASIIPVELFPHWRHRFERYRQRRWAADSWWARRMGPDPQRVMKQVRGRIAAEGPLTSRDFASERQGQSAWWGWTPEKAALEHLWRMGELAVARRVNFNKVYDLTERVLAEHAELAAPETGEHLDWACRSALERLGAATAAEIAGFWGAVKTPEVTAWCREAAAAGVIEPVTVGSVDGAAPRRAWALADWRHRLARSGDPPARMRVLSPFDPLVRDRARVLRLFGFDYRFEAFVPAPKRRYGYYVLPLLEGDRLVGRLDPRFDRRAGTLIVQSIWWEDGVRITAKRRRALGEAVERFARQIGARRVEGV